MKAMTRAQRFKTRAALELEVIPAAMAGTLGEDTQVAAAIRVVAVIPVGEDTRAAVAIPVVVAGGAAIAAGTLKRMSGWSN